MAEHVENSRVDLGFMELVDEKLLKSQYFPSKVGGKPAWLSLSSLPGPIQCPKCQKVMTFLLQVYCPVEDQHDAFHRTIFLFVCPDPACCEENSSTSFVVFRSQLSRKNDFYSFEPPDNNSVGDASDSYIKSLGIDLCVVCGAYGSKKCGKCHRMSYCSKDHQVCDWKFGHRSQCSEETSHAITPMKNHPGVLFPEFELVMEPDDYEETEEKGEKEKTEEYRQFLQSEAAKNMLADGETAELEKMASSSEDVDQQFLKFKDRVSHESEQVLRYEKGGDPLWISCENIPMASDIPPCSCGAPRQFEFQILPQMLNHLGVDSVGDSIDWGTLCIYTCTKNCSIGNRYCEEFLWKQDFSCPKKR